MTSRAAPRVCGLALCCILGGQGAAATRRAQKRPVFPGAVGFGIDTPAGRGGRIIRVGSLAADGTGSLRAALETRGPRVVIFEVGGVIDLGKKSLRIAEPFVTVAGQTAPSPGITVIRGGIYITTHDVLIRHIRVRPGDAGERKRSGWEPDGISTSGGEAYNIVVDHCSVSWATDENLSASGPRLEGPKATSHDITFSNCIIAECLSNSTHAKGRHSKGSLIHDCCTNIAIIGNLYAHNDRRNPYFKAHTTGAIVNNLVYNPGNSGVQVSWVPGEWREAKLRPVNCRISVVGNTMMHGRNTRKGLALVSGKGDVYMKDNIATDREGRRVKLTSGKVKVLKETPVWPEGLEAMPASDVVEHVLKHAGARPADRDEIDKRIVREFREKKGRIIDSQNDVGGYPKYPMTTRRLNVTKWNVEALLVKLAAQVEGR